MARGHLDRSALFVLDLGHEDERTNASSQALASFCLPLVLDSNLTRANVSTSHRPTGASPREPCAPCDLHLRFLALCLAVLLQGNPFQPDDELSISVAWRGLWRGHPFPF